MKRDVALRIDALLMSVRGNLDMIVHYIKDNLSNEEYLESKLQPRIWQKQFSYRTDFMSCFQTSFQMSCGLRPRAHLG